MTKKEAKTLNEAIVNKLDSVLKNTEFIDSFYITIQGERGVIPTITYKITELITPKEAHKPLDEDIASASPSEEGRKLGEKFGNNFERGLRDGAS